MIKFEQIFFPLNLVIFMSVKMKRDQLLECLFIHLAKLILIVIICLQEMRYIMKGGVWKNSQDQILKAAIMKYGLNQWSRISSLLQRKSAKQCKQRWYQWLDPSIKKTQWSRSQDQKLLQLARVFPSQWRTIAPFVGRTPTQCFQRYEKLLDLAQGKTGQQTEDLKRLRPGQIDPNPETKPARLDPIDMDEDQKQMLAQVRVRLANTKGKKAKRKQREKIIEEARRLAQLQKIRQLQMAGVDNIPTAKQIKRMRQKQDIDYNKDIPFKREIPEFVYKLEQNETSRNTFFASTISLQTLEGKRRDVQEQLQRKLDKKRIKRLKDTDYKAMMTLKNKFQKPIATPILLPEPQLNQKDLEDMKKYNITTPLNSIIHNSTPFGMTPENKIMLSARINYSLNHRDIMTPIGQDPSQNVVDGVKELNYLKELEKQEKDPNKIRSVNRLISERVKTPSAQNQWEDERTKVKSLFKNLKKPEYEVQFQISEESGEDDVSQNNREIDAEQLYKIQEQLQRKKLAQRLQSRNQALKLNLQRIKNIPTHLVPNSHDPIEQLIQKQMISMLYSDAIDYPLEVTVMPEKHTFKYEGPLSLQKRNSAFELIQKQIRESDNVYMEDEYEQSYNKAKKHLKINISNKTVTKEKKQIGQQTEKRGKFYKQIANLASYKNFEKANDHSEKKAKKFLGGYQKLISTKIQEVNNLEQQLQKLKMLRQTLEVLQIHQTASAVRRLQSESNYYKMIYNSI